MFKGSCDVCGASVIDMLKLKVLDPKMQRRGQKHICEACQNTLNSKIRTLGEKKQTEILNEVKEWLGARANIRPD